MAKIQQIIAREILSSGSTPSVEVKVVLETGTIGVASVPYGASAGISEAFVLLDGDKNRFMGKGMIKAVENVNKIIAPVLIGMDVGEVGSQNAVDQKMIELDGTERKTNLGANAILGVSLAVARASANDQKLPMYRYIRQVFGLEKYGLLPGSQKPAGEGGCDYVLPNPMMVVIEGGAHADESTDLQEYMISLIGNDSVAENVRRGIEIYFTLKKVLKDKGYNSNVGNEGAFAPNGLPSNETPLELIKEAVEKSGYIFGKDVGISLDPAVSEIYENEKYELAKDGKNLNSDEMINYFVSWINNYPIITLEDALAETDWQAWPKLTEKVGDKIAIVGDDLTVTNPKLLQKAIDLKAINSILIKLNQIGTLSETVECCMLARQNGIMTIISHRGGGETNDTTMIDLAVAVNAGFVKVGPSRGERVEKYNRLMEIETELAGNCTVAGSNFRKII
jgi:enolase